MNLIKKYAILFDDTKVLGFNQYQKSDKEPFVFHADLEYLIEKNDGCKNNPENLFTTKLSDHIPSDFSMSTTSSFKRIENNHGVYGGKDCMKEFLESLRGRKMKINNFKKERVKLLSNEKQNSYQNSKICYICKEKFENKYVKDKKSYKVRDHCH